jgi:proline dehydrogenase
LKIDFQNTEKAFVAKTDGGLKKAHLLFNTISRPSIVSLSKVLLNIALKLRIPINWAVKPTIYSHFVGGESIEDAYDAIRTLEKHGVLAILDYSVEGKESEEDIQAALEETLRAIKNAGEDANIPCAVFKPTAFSTHDILKKASSGEEMNEDELRQLQAFKDRIDILCGTAFEANIPILIDAEDVWFQAIIDEVTNEMMAKYNKESCIVYNTFQMYRKDRLAFLDESYKMAEEGNYFLGAKFVRGAYMEKERARAEEGGYPDPIQNTKADTDKDYNAALKYCVERIDRISIFNGTHNEYSTQYLIDLMEEHGIAKDDERILFSQLYGMSDNLSFNVAAAGYRVSKYLPYGPVSHVLPYLIRRAEENTSAADQSGRELNLIKTELRRRKTNK